MEQTSELLVNEALNGQSLDDLVAKVERMQRLQTELVNLLQAVHQVALLSEADPDGSYTFVNPRFEEVTGYTADEIRGKPFDWIKSGHQQEELYDDVWTRLRSGRVWTGCLKNKAKNGAYFWQDSTIFPMQNAADELVKIICVGFPVTDWVERQREAPLRLQAAHELSEDNSTRRLQQLNQELQQVKLEHKTLSQALNQAALAVETDLRGVITHVNEPFLRLSQYARHELIGQSLSALHADDGGAFEELWRTVAEGQVWRGAVAMKTKEGAHFWADLAVAPILNQDGKTEQYYAIGLDITARRHAQEILQQRSENEHQRAERLDEQLTRASSANQEYEKLQTLLFSQVTALNETALVSETDSDGTIIFVNDNFLKSSGFPREELLGHKHNVLKSDGHDDEFFAKLWVELAAGRPWKGMFRNRRKDEGVFWTYACITPIFDADDKIIQKYVSVQIDVTMLVEQREYVETMLSRSMTHEEELQKTTSDLFFKLNNFQAAQATLEHKLTALQEGLVMLECNAEWRITFVNNEYVKRTGVQSDNLLDKQLTDLIDAAALEVPPGEYMAEWLQGENEGLLLPFRRQQGKVMWLHCFLQNVSPDHTPKYLAFGVDVSGFIEDKTAHKTQIQELESQKEDPQEMEWLRENVEQLNREKESLGYKIDAATQSREQLSASLLEAKNEAAEALDVMQRQQARVLELEAQAASVAANPEIEAAHQVEVEALKAENNRLKEELVQAHAGHRDAQQAEARIGSLEAELEIAVRTTDAGRQEKEGLTRAVIALEGELDGLRADYRQLSDTLVQTRASLREEQEQKSSPPAEDEARRARVLDLEAEVRRLQDALAGQRAAADTAWRHETELRRKIDELTSELTGARSQASVMPPPVVVEAPRISPPPAPSIVGRSRPGRVLVVDTDEQVLTQATQILGELGVEFLMVRSGDEVVHLYESWKPEMLFMDLRLPVVNGFEVLDIIRTDYEDNALPVIALVPENLAQHRQEYLANGFNGILVKPFSTQELTYFLQTERS